MFRLRLNVRSVNLLRVVSVCGPETATLTFVGIVDKISQRSCYPGVGVGIPVVCKSARIVLLFNLFCLSSDRGLLACALKTLQS